ncbi:hypothetical protein SBC2_73010 (plasmid) [Caballeronia sp. SBC2]|nr:hypothetical protein SBC2_73010 [Caballeronia sp. SBC2]
MKIVVRVELITDWGDVNTIEVGRIDRPSQTLDPKSVGLLLADGKQLLHNLQQAVIPAQADDICCLRRICRRCHQWTALKDYRRRKVDTVFGTVSFRSPRVVSCACEPPWYSETAFCPLWPIVPEWATPELSALQAKLAAQMTYRRVVEIMREFLPVSEKINHVTVRNRTLRVGTRIDAIELPGAQPRNPTTEWTLAIDGGFVRGKGKAETRNQELRNSHRTSCRAGEEAARLRVCAKRVAGSDRTARFDCPDARRDLSPTTLGNHRRCQRDPKHLSPAPV